jgi:putative zinc finger protein
VRLEDEIKLLVKDRKSGGLWPRRCPEHLQLAAYVDGTSDATTRENLERHLADCTRCRDEISFLVRADEWPDAEKAPPWLGTKAEKLVLKPSRKSFAFDWRWATAAVAASFAILFLVLFVTRFRTPNPPVERVGAEAPPTNISVPVNSPATTGPRNNNVIAQSSPIIKPAKPNPEPSAPLIRKSETPNGSPNLLAPRDGSSVKRGALTVRWQNVPDAAFYEVSIMTASGDLVISRQTESQWLELTGDLPLQTNAKYFVSVRAHMRDGRTNRSSIVSFRMID